MFLERYPLAKIVIVVDTHCLQETGGLVWEGAGANINACSLWEVGDGIVPDWLWTTLTLIFSCFGTASQSSLPHTSQAPKAPPNTSIAVSS